MYINYKEQKERLFASDARPSKRFFFIHKLFSDNARYVLILSSVSNFVFNRGPRTRKLPASLVAQLVKNPPAVQGTWV